MADNAEASNRKEITEIMEFSAPKNVEKQTMWSISLMKGKSSDISSVYMSKQSSLFFGKQCFLIYPFNLKKAEWNVFSIYFDPHPKLKLKVLTCFSSRNSEKNVDEWLLEVFEIRAECFQLVNIMKLKKLHTDIQLN